VGNNVHREGEETQRAKRNQVASSWGFGSTKKNVKAELQL